MSVENHPDQYKIYINLLNNHEIFKSGRLMPDKDAKVDDNLWKELVQQLNSCGSGPQKDIKGWKTVFTDWKSAVKKKARLFYSEINKTTGGPSKAKPLTEIENEFLHAIGAVVVHCIEEVPEASGLEDPAETETTAVPIKLEMDFTTDGSAPEPQTEGEPSTSYGQPPSSPTLFRDEPTPTSHFQHRRKRKALPNVVKAFMDSSKDLVSCWEKINENLTKVATSQERIANSQDELVQIKKMKLQLEILKARKDGVNVDFDVYFNV